MSPGRWRQQVVHAQMDDQQHGDDQHQSPPIPCTLCCRCFLHWWLPLGRFRSWFVVVIYIKIKASHVCNILASLVCDCRKGCWCLLHHCLFPRGCWWNSSILLEEAGRQTLLSDLAVPLGTVDLKVFKVIMAEDDAILLLVFTLFISCLITSKESKHSFLVALGYFARTRVEEALQN